MTMLWLVMLLYIGLTLNAPAWYWVCFIIQTFAVAAKVGQMLDKEE